LEERWLYAVDILECILKEDQHSGIHYLVFILGVSFIIKVVHVSAEVLHSMQYITIASERHTIIKLNFNYPGLSAKGLKTLTFTYEKEHVDSVFLQNLFHLT
jgi:hypothetical protein